MNIDNIIKDVLDEVFEIRSNLDLNEYYPDNISKWDSANHIKMCLKLESKFNITFENDELETLINIKIISNTIRSHLE